MNNEFSASAIYNLISTANYPVISQGLDEGEWKISEPDEEYNKISLLNSLIGRMSAISDSNYWHPRKEAFPAPAENISAHERLILQVLEAGADPWKDPKVFPMLLTRPFYTALERVISHPSFDFEKAHGETLEIKDWDSPIGDPSKTVPVQIPLLQALSGLGNEFAIRLLLKTGWKVDEVDPFGRTALFFAKYPEMVELLINKGADPEHRSKSKLTAPSAWSKRTFQTVAEIQNMQKSLPRVRRKKGTATSDDLRAFVQTLLTANKTKVLGEIRRLGVSFEQIFDGKTIFEHVLENLGTVVARTVSMKDVSNWTSLSRMVDTTALLIEEQVIEKKANLSGIPYQSGLAFFAALRGSSVVYTLPKNPDSALKRIEHAALSEPLFESFLKKIPSLNDTGTMLVQGIFQRWTAGILGDPENQLPLSVWCEPASNGEIPFFKFHQMMQDWFERFSLNNPSMPFDGFSVNLEALDKAKELEKLPLHHPLWTDPLSIPAFFASFQFQSHSSYHHTTAVDQWGLSNSKPRELYLAKALNAGAVWPLNDKLLHSQWENYFEKKGSTPGAQTMSALRERSRLETLLNQVEDSSPSGPKRRL